MLTKSRIRFAVMVVTAGALLAFLPTTASGSKNADLPFKIKSMSCVLSPTGVDPDASGQAKLTNVKVTLGSGEWSPLWVQGTQSVTCRGLEPDQGYSVTISDWSLGTFATSANGELKARGWCNFIGSFGWEPSMVPVVVRKAGGESVLEGSFILDVVPG